MSSPWANKLPPGMTDLKLELHRDDNVPITHFNRFVYPEPPPNKLLPECFHRFEALPLETRIMIIQHCDKATLFHLMHTCSYLRRESLKLFWQPDTDFCYRSEHGFDSLTMKPVMPYNDPEFYSRITQIEIPLIWHSDSVMELTEAGRNKDIAGYYREFWATLQRKYPMVRQVILSSWQISVDIAPSRFEIAEMPPRVDEYKAPSYLVRQAPKNLDVLVGIHGRERPFDKHPGLIPHETSIGFSLWRVGPEPLWNLVNRRWNPMRVYLPWKKVPRGLLSDFFAVYHRSTAQYTADNAAIWFKMQTYLYYSNDGQIDCPDVDCHFKFECLRDWIEHLEKVRSKEYQAKLDADLCMYNMRLEPFIPQCHPGTPVREKALVNKTLSRAYQDAAYAEHIVAKLRSEFMENGVFLREKFRKSLVPQLKKHGFMEQNETPDWHSEFLMMFERRFLPDFNSAIFDVVELHRTTDPPKPFDLSYTNVYSP